MAGPGKPAHDIPQNRPPELGIDLHSRDGVDKGQGISPDLFHRPCNTGDIPAVRRELDHEVHVRNPPQDLHQSRGKSLLHTEGDTPFLDVGAGDIDLQGSDAIHTA